MSANVRLHGDQLIASRQLDADPDLIWTMFTTPAHLAAFWGGDHAAVTPGSVLVDLRVGGTFELETAGPDDSTHRLSFRYDEIDPPNRLVLTEPHTGLTTAISLRASAGGTSVIIHQRRLPPELRTEQARTGLAGILRRLGVVADELSDRERRRDR